MIKRQPEDFHVEELLSSQAAASIAGSEGAFTVYRLEKRGLGTDEALEQIARRLEIPLERIHFAGLKDKHAVTVQYVSINFGRGGSRTGLGSPPDHLRGSAPGLIETPAWKLKPVGTSNRAIRAEDISGNRFRVAVRHLSRRQCETITHMRRFLSLPGARGGRMLRFVNYYGEQRFGSARHGRGFAARRFIEGDFEEGLRLIIAVPDRKDSRERKMVKREIAAGWGGWASLRKTLPPCPEQEVVERLARTGGNFRAGFSALPHFVQQIVIEAYQSRLWNEIARRLIERECMHPCIRVPSPFGDLVFPRAASAPPETVSVVIPLLSPRTALREPWKDVAEEVLSEEGIRTKGLRVPGMEMPYFGEVPRPLFADALDFSIGPFEPDESAGGAGRFKRRARFTLPRGAYGTVLLAALSGAPQNILR